MKVVKWFFGGLVVLVLLVMLMVIGRSLNDARID